MNELDSTREIVGMRSRTSTSEGYAAVFATILIWSTPSLFQYYLNRYYDPWAQNFYRYLVACVSTVMENRSHRPPWIIHCIYRHILLGALRHLGETAFPGARLDSQLRGNQLDHVCAAVSAHNCIWKNWHSDSRRTAS